MIDIIINNINIKNYDAKLISRTIYPSDIYVERFWDTNHLNPIINKDLKNTDKQLVLEIEFKGNENQILKNKSNLVKNISISTIKFSDVINTFRGFIDTSTVQHKVKGYEVLSIQLSVIEEGPEVTETLNNILSKTLVVDGNEITPVRMEITPAIALVDVTVEGIGETFKIKNLTKGKTILIEKGLVLEGSANKFPDYESWSFPYLSPGSNKVTVDKNNLNITIKYKPRWV